MLRAVQHSLMLFASAPIPTQSVSIWITALVFNAVLIGLAQRLPLLTPAGWCHAGLLGTVLWGALGWRGWMAVVAYLGFGSLVTKLGFARKQDLGLAEARGGRRGPENVWGSALTGLVLALLIAMRVGPTQGLLIGFAASFAAKLADTFGSEIGKRWGRTTLLITSLRPVPPGTEGAVSLEGTAASALGSLLMTLVVVALGLIPPLKRRRGCGWVHCHPAREPLGVVGQAAGPGSAMSRSFRRPGLQAWPCLWLGRWVLARSRDRLPPQVAEAVV